MLGFGLGAPGTWLLPRPFSVGWRADDGRVGILLRVFGAGTRALGRLVPGDEALLLGPLGQPFTLDPGRRIECVAGGVGLAPFIFLAAVEAAAGRRVRLLYGERTGPAVFDLDLLGELTGHDPEVFTEDGSVGTPGRVTAGLDPASDALLFGCGPTPMLRALAALAAETGRDLQVSVEEHMGCGIGTCQGCVVRSADGRWVRSCIEGPVFDASALRWDGS
jgi:dihydroorotate dehydrogenase electron transfer subunit